MSEYYKKCLRIRNTLFNYKYIKEIKCDSDTCAIIIANTDIPYGNRSSYDNVVTVCKKDNPADYEKLKKITNSE